MSSAIEDTATEEPQSPELSVVLVTKNRYEVISRTMAHLARQTIASRIEVLLMSPLPEQLVVPEEIAQSFFDVRSIDLGSERRVGAARAMGIEAARAAFVAMCEDHCFMNAVWAETLLQRHAEGADVVGPAMANCNPETLSSWVAFFVGYAPWVDLNEVTTVDFLPGHNSSYRRDLVLAKGSRLRDLMSSEVILHWELRDQGCRLVCDPALRCRHVNVTETATLSATMFDHSRNFGALRGQNMGTAKKIIYAMASPLLPGLRTYRTLPILRRHLPDGFSRWKSIGMLTRVFATSTAGELSGIYRGFGRSPWADWDKELDRSRLVRIEDTHLLHGDTPAGDREPPSAGTRLNRTVRIGLIGAGRLAREVQIPCLRRIEGVDLVAIADVDAGSRELASQIVPGGNFVEAADTLLADERIDAVIVSTPSATHAALACAALDAGKHVYLEKPIAVDPEGGQRVIDAWQRTGLIGMIGFNYRLRSDYMNAAALVAANELGRVNLISVTFSTRLPENDDWRRPDRAGGGVLLDLASHEFDLVQLVAGEPIDRVLASSLRGGEGPGESILVQAWTKSGIAVRGFFSSESTDEATMEVVGSVGKIRIDRYAGLTLDHRGTNARGPVAAAIAAFRNLAHPGPWIARRRSPWNEGSFELALTRFVRGVRCGNQPQPDLDAGLQSLLVVDAARRSLRSGEIVEVATPEPATREAIVK
jgi:predicted dehydrogenase